LHDAIAALKKEQFNLRFQKASGQLEATAAYRCAARYARIKTVLGERGRAASQAKA